VIGNVLKPDEIFQIEERVDQTSFLMGNSQRIHTRTETSVHETTSYHTVKTRIIFIYKSVVDVTVGCDIHQVFLSSVKMTSEQGEVKDQGVLGGAGEKLDPSRLLRFEDPCFDPAFYINTRFPNGMSSKRWLVSVVYFFSPFPWLLSAEESFLSGGVSSTSDDSEGSSLLDLHIESLKIEIQQVDSCILDAVRRQSASGQNARQQLHAAHATIRKAMSQVEEMKVKAAEHEQMVEKVCKDIRQLDNAKKNLTTAITGLRRLGMLIDAVNQLQIAAEKRNFKEAGSLLGAVKQLLSHFVPSYSHIAKIAELKGRINALEQSLRLASLREFELLGEDAPPQHVVQVLKDCCTVTGAIGTSARDELVDIICRREMNMYTQIFGTVGETAKLERTVNRYKWFIRRLDSRSIIWSIFPEDWRVTQLLALTYCSITKSELAQILAEADAESLSRDVDGLLKAIEATHVFEAEMTRRFFVEQSSEEHDDLDDEFFGQESCGDDSLSASDLIRKKYKNVSTRDVKEEEKRALLEGAAEAAVKHATFKNSISPVFEPYMFIYIDDVTRSLSHRLETSIVSEKWIAMSDDQQILKSSDALTSMIREELKHCSTKISRGSTLLELGKVFKKLYQSYASALMSKLPKTSSGKTSGIAQVGSTAWHIKMTAEDIGVIVLLISTSDHCIKMIGQLESAIEKRLQDSFQGKVDIGDAEDAFNDVITQSLSVLLLGVETKLDIPLAILMRKNWQAFDMTGDQSDFTIEACAILKDLGRRIRPPALSMNYFTYFCDKLIRSFAPRIFDALFKCGPISQAGGQQLRLDLEAYRAAFITLAKEGSSLLSTRSPGHETPANESLQNITRDKTWAETFASDVTSAFRTSESVLKVVSSPLGSVADTLLELMPGASSTDLQHILELMGIKKADMTQVIDVFCTKKDEIGHSNNRISKPLPAPTFSHGLAINNPAAHSFALPPGAAAKASAAAQDMASHISRIRSSANAQAAKFSAAMKRDSGNARSN